MLRTWSRVVLKTRLPRHIVAITSLVLLFSAAASGTAGATLTQFQAPSVAITAGPDGNLWFTTTGAIGRITPSGSVTYFPLPSSSTPTSGITTGPDGNLWFSENSAVGRITPSGTITEFPITVPNAGCVVFPEDLVPSDITAGPDGNIWFVAGALSANTPHDIGRITPTGTVTWFSVPPGSCITGIAGGPDGNVWFTDSGLNQVGRITPTGTITTFSIPTHTAARAQSPPVLTETSGSPSGFPLGTLPVTPLKSGRSRRAE